MSRTETGRPKTGREPVITRRLFRHAAPIAVVTVLLVGLYWSTELLPGPWVQAANPAQSPQLVASLAPSAGRVPEPQGGKTGHGPNVTATPQPAAHNVELIGHVEGDAYSVAVRGNTAYVGMRLSVPRFVVLDVSEHNQPHTLGVLPSMKDDVWGINVVSPYAYLANRSAGLWLVDVSNPNVPLAKATYTPPDYAWDVFVTGGYAYVAAGVSGGLRVVDVSTPWAPRQVGVNNTPGGDARDVAISGNYAYVADWDQGLRVVDVSTPRAPQEVGVYDTQGYAAGVFVAGGYAYVADRDQGLRVVDVANPRVPQEVGAYNTQGNAAGVFVAAGYAYIADSDDGLRVVDVANPRAPREVGFYDPRQGTAVGVFVAGDYVYLADRSGGLLILRFIAPPTPTGTPTSTPTSTLSPTPTDTPTPTPCPDSFEPDDQWFQAKVLSIETPQRHTFHVPGDVDWVKFVAQAGYHYTIRTLGLAPHVDTVLCLYGTNGQELLVPCNDDDPTNPPASRIDWDCQADGTYFVKTNNLDPQVGGCNLAYSIEIVGAMITPTPTVTASATRTSTLIPTATATATPTATHTATPTPISTGTSTSAPTLTPSATPTSILTLTPCPDSFEPDDQWFRAGVLIVGNPPQHHTLHVAGDVDWVKFVAQVGYHYIIRTLELAPGVDTLLCLYDVDGQALVSCNDDDPTNPPASQIDWTCQADGTYFVNVSNLDPQAGGCDLRYSIEVTEATITPTPTATPRSGRAYLPIIRRDLTPTPTPIPTPLICNGRFEVGHLEPCWQEGGELGRWVVDRLDVGEPTPTFEGAYAGNYSALLGDPGLGPGLPGQRGIPVGSAWIEQAIVVPNTAAPRLSFRYRIMTYDVAQDAKGRWYDIFEVQINGEQVFWDGNKVPGTSQQRHDLNWRLGEVDLSRWRGRTVIVRFANWNGYGSGPGSELYDTWTYLDEVQVEP